MESQSQMVGSMMTLRRWIAHPGHTVPTWTAELRRELVAAFRRGTMNAERCLRTYRIHGELGMLPAEAVVYLAVKVAADRETGRTGRARSNGLVTAEMLRDAGERELAELHQADPDRFEDLVEAGRRFFFPVVRAIG